MAKAATTVVDTAKKTKKKSANVSKKPTRAKRAIDEISEQAENELVNGNSAVPMKRVEDNGNVNITSLSPSDKKYYGKIASVLNENDITSVTTYGSDLQRAMDSYSSDFLKQSFSAKSSNESAQLITNLLGELREVNVGDLERPNGFKRFLMMIPGINKLVTSIEQIKDKYETIEKNIDSIVGKLEAARQISIRDNNLLQKQFENNCDYVDQLQDLIIVVR